MLAEVSTFLQQTQDVQALVVYGRPVRNNTVAVVYGIEREGCFRELSGKEGLESQIAASKVKN